MNRIDRLMAMTLFLQGRRLARAEDIARRFEISLRTVYRDMAALSEAGVPIVAEAGVGYSLMKGYYLPPIMFSVDEASALGTAGLALRRTSDASMARVMESALAKIRAAMPDEQRRRLERIETSVGFETRGGDRNSEGAAATLLRAQEALAESRLVSLVYRSGSRQERSVREVEPMGLVFYLEYWHLIAWCRLRGGMRDFRLDRIEKMEALSEKVDSREFDADAFLKRCLHPDKVIETRIRFARMQVDRAKREWSLGLLGEERLADESILTLSTGDLDWMVGWLLSFREGVEVLEPKELKERLRVAAEELAIHHG